MSHSVLHRDKITLTQLLSFLQDLTEAKMMENEEKLDIHCNYEAPNFQLGMFLESIFGIQ